MDELWTNAAHTATAYPAYHEEDTGGHEQQPANASFIAFKQTGKFHSMGRGVMSAEVYTTHQRLRIDKVIELNGGKWPGLSTRGDDFHRVVITDNPPGGPPQLFPAEEVE